MAHVCPSWMSCVLYNPVRKAFTDREKVLEESGITADSIVLEIGAGNGFLTEALAGHAKKVISVEFQDGMVRKLKKRVGRFGDKIDIITADISFYRVGDSIADVCILYYCFHEISNKADAVNNISRALRSEGQLSIYEPGIEVNKTQMRKTIELFQDSGFVLKSERNGLFTRFALLRKS